MCDMDWIEEARSIANGIRKRVLGITIERDGSYLSQACSSAEILATLYTKILKLNESTAPKIPPAFTNVPGKNKGNDISGKNYNGKGSSHTDRFIVSPAHYAAAVYAVLAEVGRMDQKGLDQFNTDGSTVEMIGAEHSPGFELTTGSFGQALSQAGGIALVRKHKGDSGRVFVFMSDGEFQEGQTWEGIQAASFYKLDNLVVYVDVNGQQVDGWTKDVMNIEPLDKKLEAFGASVLRVDGHNIEALAKSSEPNKDGKPLFVLCYTNTSEGLPLLDKRKPNLHYVRFKTDEEKMQFSKLYESM
ncbi:hypothetical protein SPD79_09900 [Oceanobacillus sp. SE10311]